ncbi:MAG: substrate-binding domain-containing protein [Rhodospirillaceae bacterium]|nr:substrate-binding domain-containing protein [Rhodospirillaceae bacterium]
MTNRFGRIVTAVACAAALFGGVQAAQADDDFIILQSTTSTQNSGLFDHILPMFTDATGIEVRVVAVGTGQAISNARNGDGDALLVHDTAAEEAFVEEGYGVARQDVMYNDFVIVGPADDPAGVDGLQDAVAALQAIADAEAPFASRGDDSGTHRMELRLWADTDTNPEDVSGTWYNELGAGMGATLNAAVGMGAYALTDRGTWISFENKQDHAILVQGDVRLFNQYGVIAVDPERNPNVKYELAQQFVDWITGPDGQAAITGFKLNGEQLFFPNAPEGS